MSVNKFVSRGIKWVNQSINQSVFLEWPKWLATARTATGVTVNVTE